MSDRGVEQDRVVVVGDGRAADQIAAAATSAGLAPTMVSRPQLTPDLLQGVACVFVVGEANPTLWTRFSHTPIVTVTLGIGADGGDGHGQVHGATVPLAELSGTSLGMAMAWAGAIAHAARRETSFRQVLNVVARTNRAVMHAEDPTEFMAEACRIAVDVGGFALAWIGCADADADQLRSMASAGAGRDYVDAVRIPLGPDAPVGPTLQAIRTHAPAICSDILADACMVKWRALAVEHGLRSSVALPIPLQNGSLGALNVYADVTAAFGDDVVDLLSQLAEDIAAGIEVLSERRHRHEAQRLLADTTQVLDLIAGGSPLGDCLTAVGTMAARHHTGTSCEILRTTPDRQHLLPVGSPLLPALSSLQPVGAALDPSLPWVRALHERAAVHVSADDEGIDPLLAAALARDQVATLDAAPVVDAKGDPTAIVLLAAPRTNPNLPGELVAATTRLVATAIGAADANDRLSREALTDALTGLGNRALFTDRVGHSLERAEPAAVLMMDLDRFRLVNESFGLDAGKQVLVGIAERLAPLLDPGDTLARTGGDEFGVLLQEPGSPAEVVTLAQRISEALAEPLAIGDERLTVTGSLGVAFAPPATTAEEAMTNAEVAMYRAKRLGGDRVEIFDDELRSQAGWWMKVQAALHHALRQAGAHLDRSGAPPEQQEDGTSPGIGDGATLTVLYQPEFRIEDRRLIGAEALSRLHTASLGDVPPDRFVAVAAAAPALAAALYAVVLDDACRQVAQWRQHQPDAWVAVNITASQLIDGGLIGTTRLALERHGLDPSSLCLEITETDVMREVDVSLATLDELDRLGIQTVIDDFGTGYSSLSYAKRLPVRWLKIDRGFVAGLGMDPADSAIVAAAVAMGHSLGLTVTAEGVETATQLEALADLGCDLAQGYLFSRPMPAAAIAELFSAPAPLVGPAGIEPATEGL